MEQVDPIVSRSCSATTRSNSVCLKSICLRTSRIPLRQVAGETGKVDVVCDLRELPFAANSIDLVVLPHVLEFHDNPHQILREVERHPDPGRASGDRRLQPPVAVGARRRLLRLQRGEFPWNGSYICR